MTINLDRRPVKLDTVATGHKIKDFMDEKKIAIKEVSKAMNVSPRRYIDGRRERPSLLSAIFTSWDRFWKRMWTICLLRN